MAQLPPRVPNMATNWPQFSSQKMISSPILDQNMGGGGGGGGGSWVDELLDFSAAKRGSHGHRRSMSDSVAFLDIPMAEECRRSSNILPPGGGGGGGSGGVFDADEQLIMSMFNTDAADDIMGGSAGGPNMSCSNPSSPSDLNNNNNNMNEDEKQQQMMKSEPEEVESSSCKSDQQGQMFAAHIIGSMDNSNDKIVDPKRIKRILANRQSAQRSRVRKLQYVSELERSVTSLQAEISVLSPRVAYLDHQRLILGVDNSVLKQRIAALSQDKIFKDAHQEALKREIERLRQVYNYQQNLKKEENASAQHELKSQPSHVVNAYAEKEQLAN